MISFSKITIMMSSLVIYLFIYGVSVCYGEFSKKEWDTYIRESPDVKEAEQRMHWMNSHYRPDEYTLNSLLTVAKRRADVVSAEKFWMMFEHKNVVSYSTISG